MREGLQRKAHKPDSNRTLSGGVRLRTCSGKPDPFALQNFKVGVEWLWRKGHALKKLSLIMAYSYLGRFISYLGLYPFDLLFNVNGIAINQVNKTNRKKKGKPFETIGNQAIHDYPK